MPLKKGKRPKTQPPKAPQVMPEPPPPSGD
jgi:hypothetical protein